MYVCVLKSVSYIVHIYIYGYAALKSFMRHGGLPSFICKLRCLKSSSADKARVALLVTSACILGTTSLLKAGRS